MDLSCQRLPVNAVPTNRDFEISFISSDNNKADIDMMLNTYSSFKEQYPDTDIVIYSFGSDADPHGLSDLSCGDASRSQRKSYFSIGRASICSESTEKQEELIERILQNKYIDSFRIDINGQTDSSIYLSDINISENHNLKELYCKIKDGKAFDINKFKSLTKLYLCGAVIGDDLSFINEASNLKELYIVDQGFYYNNDLPDLDVIDQSRISVYVQNGWHEFNAYDHEHGRDSVVQDPN